MRVFKICFFMSVLAFLLQANELIYPNSSIGAKNSVISSVVNNNILYLVTDNGTIEIFDLKNSKNIKTISLEPIEAGFSTILHAPRVSHIDVYNNGEKLLIVSDDTEAGKALHIHKNGATEKIFSNKDRLNISKAYFLDEDRVIIGLLGNEVILYDLKSKKTAYRVQPYWSMLIDFMLNGDKTLSFVAAESGVVYTLNTQDGVSYKNYDLHTDIILSIDTKKDILITGGADKKLFVYDLENDTKYSFATDFLVYSVGLSPSGKLGAYIANENNDISIFDTKTKDTIATLKGAEKFVNINKIIFLNENEVIASSNNNKILRWKLK
ncbi:MAG: hypothetical protein LBG67_04280 [Campylobacteraceae bacterium]|nr:hypothetical protein [Campylobacteraceae bacterium]